MKNNQLSFTADFSFQRGIPVFGGFALETIVSKESGAKYRVLVKKPDDGHFYTIKKMEEPMLQDEIDRVLREHYYGGIEADEFIFEVFDGSNNKIFATRFNAKERVPAEGYDSDKFVWTSYSWHFDLPTRLEFKSGG